MLRLRSILHLENGRNLNILSHSLQEKAAELFGCPGSRSHQRVEALMSAYFHHARIISRMLDGSVKVTRSPRLPLTTEPVGENLEWTTEGIRFADLARAALQPHTWLRAFQAAIDRKCHVSGEALSCIERHGDRYSPEEFFPTETEQRQLLQFLRPRLGLYAQLSDMHHCRLLGRMFPEFQKVYCRVIRDFYHKYTVDEHTLLTIRHLESLCDTTNPRWQRFATILRELDAPEVLTLALLFHDVGKWKIESHAEESVRMVVGPLVRLQAPPDMAQTVEFLIRNHLQMSMAAFRRDTDDPEVVRQFANLVATESNLKMLCLMTLVDVEAVSPDTLTPWKEELLWQLYVDAYNHITLGYGDEVIDRSQASLARLQEERPPDISEGELGAFLEGLPQRYLQLADRERVYRHVRLSRNIHPEQVHCSLELKGNNWELSVTTLDKPHLFSNVCGVLSYFGMDILRGQAMTNTNGLVLDMFQFTGRGRILPPESGRDPPVLAVAPRRRGWAEGSERNPAGQRAGHAPAARSHPGGPDRAFRQPAFASVHGRGDRRRERVGVALPNQPRHFPTRLQHRPSAHFNGGPQGHRRVSHHPGASQAHRRGAAGARGRPRSAARELR